MTESIPGYWNQLQAAKENFVGLVDAMNSEQRKLKPSDGGWNALQVVEHILFSETGTLGYMIKKTSSGWEGHDNEDMEHSEKGNQLIDRLKSDEKYKAPSILPEPKGEASWEELQERWMENRIHFEAFLNLFDPQFEHKLVFKQPYAGMITLEKALQFLCAHIHHHVPQIKALSAL
jgi:hypothetical protein